VVHGRHANHPQPPKRILANDPAATDASIVPDLAHGFEVSEQAMEIRLVNLGLRRQI